ncbi:MBL fold metallo-hydrolase [Brachybacterium alimentarium]|uniref:MBL fold metallo-hydrolase n=1 Tax=Brachybacterium alimentarium TaxID=47845 RepID=UPI000DF40DD5|nr:MBL fold metallo-hydrolase [Brachybacterium alimentarium]RCS67879.1 MBL fold metallo-hydrolase [Brachybacterium alimentarium]RCS80885.1 MBL fold metallo-hydrolase [Brachybacterium alimentarium]
MRIHVIGCSGSFAGPGGAASSYLLEQEDENGRVWRVLMDLGSGAFGPLQSAIDPADLDAVLISHLHPDHFLDLTGLEVFWAYHERDDLPQLPIHAPEPLPERLSAVLGRKGPVPDGVDCVPFDYHVLRDHQQFSIGPFDIQVREVVHPVEAYGFRITAGGDVLAYSGDTDTCQALDDLAVGADLFLCEAGYIEGRDDRFTGVHLTGLRAGEAAVTAQAGRVVLTHIAAWTDPAVPLAEARSVYPGPLELATPKAVYDTSRAESPS